MNEALPPLPPLLPVIPTPFVDGRFDETGFSRFLDHLDRQVDGFVLLGSTGEAPSLSVEERCHIAERVLTLTPRDLTVVVGVSTNNQADSVRLAQHAQGLGAAGVLCAAPSYFPAEPDGVLRFLAAVDAAIDIDLVFYDNPCATKFAVGAGEVVSWSQRLAHLRTVKLTDHDLSKIACWQLAGLRVYGGDDPIAFRFLRAGVDGVMMIAPAVFPHAFRRVWEQSRAGAWDEALTTFGRHVATFSHVFGVGDEVATTKALFASLGIYASAEVLPPLTPVGANRIQLLRTAYALGFEHPEAAVVTGQPAATKGSTP